MNSSLVKANMSLEDFINEDWTLYGEFSTLGDIEPAQFAESNATTLQYILKCPDGDMLNGSFNSDEVVSAVSPQQGLSPLGTPPTSPPQFLPLNEANEFSNILQDLDLDIAESQITTTEEISSDELDLNGLLNFDFTAAEPEKFKEEISILQGALELSKVCEALDEEPASPISVRSHPYKDSSLGRHPDKKLRKKQQNKDAAVRYRLKKKSQKQVQGGELEELLELNKNLNSECKEKIREIEYLKELLLDVCKAKGLEPPIQCQ